MVVKTDKTGQTLIVKIEGDLDLNTAPAFREAVEEKLAYYENLKNIVVDFSEVTFLDSSGLGVLLGRFKHITQIGGKMGLVGVKSQLIKVLELSGILRIMELFDTKDEAIQRLEGRKL